MFTSFNETHVAWLTFVALVIPTSSSIAGRAMGTRAAMLVWSLADPVAPAEGKSGQLVGENESSAQRHWARGLEIT